MNRAKRWNQLVELVHAQNYLPLKEAAKQLDVSEMTVRRDVEIIEKSGLIRNIKGMLVPGSGAAKEQLVRKYDLLNAAQVQNEVKTRLGRFAADMIEEGECVIFDIGTTVEQIAAHLPADLEFEALCLTRNTLEHLCARPKVRVSLAGGVYRPDTELFISENGVDFVRSIRANKLFLSAAGIHETLGISCANRYELVYKRAILQSARQCILVADSSKFNVVRSAYFCDLSAIHAVLTDKNLSSEWVRILQERHIILYQV